MNRMIVGSIIVIFTIVVFFIGYVAFYEPISTLAETLKDAYPTTGPFTSGDDVGNFLDAIPYFFVVAIALGIISTLVWYMVWGHKKEYERY